MILQRILVTFGVVLVVVLGIDAIAACWNLTTAQPTPIVAFSSHPLSKTRPNTSLLATHEIVPKGFNSFRFIRYDRVGYIEEFRFDSTGDGVYRYVLFSDPEFQVMQTEIYVSKATIKELCMILRHADFCELGDEYDSDVYFRYGQVIGVECQGVGKEVNCSEHFPDRFVQVVNYLNQSFIPSLEMQYKTYTPMPKADAQQWKYFMLSMPLPDDWATRIETPAP